MPRTYTTKLRYSDIIQLNAGAGLSGQRILVANGAYDPDTSAIEGHQPRGFDQLMPLYNHCTVLGSRITAWFSSEESSLAQLVYLTLQGEDTTQLNPIDYLERQDCRTKVLTGRQGVGTCTLSMNYSTKGFFGRKDVLDDTSLRGDASNNPSEKAYFHLGCVAMDEASDPASINVCYNIDYIITFHEPNDVASS